MRRCLLLLFLISVGPHTAESADRPNILWLSCEDISPHLGCYGYPNARTPVLDAFAKGATLFEHAYTTAGVCAPCRSAIITGMYQTSLGTHHMRCNATMPDHVKPFPMWLQEAGYYCTNNSKMDYQFTPPKNTWDQSSRKAHWKNRPDGEPFFAVFNYGGCHESGIASESKYESATENISPCDRDVVAASLPPYYPDTPITRDDWGRYYDVITAMDQWVGEHLQALEDAGLSDNTIVVYWSDHGVGLPRAKRWLYESGTHVPLIIRVPEKWRSLAGDWLQPGTRSERLISMIDLAPSMLSLAGVTPPDYMQGRAFLGPATAEPRAYIFGARDRMDERYDIIRMVRDKQYRYVRNYEPYKTWYQYMNTPEKGRTMQEIRRSEADPATAQAVRQFLRPRKPLEELYDVDADPHELNNLAGDPAFAAKLNELRQQHLDWVVRTRDVGLIPEAELHRLRENVGSEWGILNTGEDGLARMQQLRDAAVLAGGDKPQDAEKLSSLLTSGDSVVRYWAATGIGNRANVSGWEDHPKANYLRQLAADVTNESSPLRQLLADDSENTRVAAARAILLMSPDDATRDVAFRVLTNVLDDGTQWARVHAAVVLDELDEAARPVIAAMKRNKAYRKGFVAEGKYTVRVLNKALNDLEGTSNSVK